MTKMRKDDAPRGGRRAEAPRRGDGRRGAGTAASRPVAASRGKARGSDRGARASQAPGGRASDRARGGARASQAKAGRGDRRARGSAHRSSSRREPEVSDADDASTADQTGGFKTSQGMIIGMVSGGVVLLFLLGLFFGGGDDHRPRHVPGAGAGVEEGWHSPGGQEAAPVIADDLRSADLLARIERAERRLQEIIAYRQEHPGAYRDIYHQLEMAQRVAHETEVAPRCRELAEEIRELWDERAQAELATVSARARRLETTGDKAEAYALYRDFDPQLLPRVEAEVERHRRRLRGSVQAHTEAVREAKRTVIDQLLTGKAAAARQTSRELGADDDASARWAQAGEGAALALDRYERAMRRHLEGRVGDTVTVTTADGEISGEMGHADESCIRIGTDDGLVKISWQDLTCATRTALRKGGWTPTSSHDHIVAALRALRDDDAETTRAALDSAGDHPLIPALRRRIDP